ncbi:MAG: hypothetical protein ACLQBD_30095 [Syntrophobacteraceae bacterium]
MVSFELFRALLFRVPRHVLGADAQGRFCLVLTGIGLGGGVVIWLLGRSVERMVEGHDRSI